MSGPAARRRTGRPAGRRAGSASLGRAKRKSARRWWLLPLALGLAAAATFVLVRGLSFQDTGEPPLDHIDDASRERLERVLREAENVPVKPGAPR
jgi:hypothetical protein